MEAFTYKRVGRSILRSDGAWVARVGDTSECVECHTNYLPKAQYDSRCSQCFLGHSHSQEAHDANVKRYCESLLRSVYGEIAGQQ